MISEQDLLDRPDEYEPLGSVKSIRNRAAKMPKIDLVRLFTSEKNIILLKRNLYRISQSNGSNDSKMYISELVDYNLYKYLDEHDISNYKLAEYQAVEFDDYVSLLRYINIEFLKFCYGDLKWNQFNPFREYIEVGPVDARRQVKYSEVTAADIPTINIWATQETAISCNKFRHHNAVPYYQAHMHQRHYDRSNEGLKTQSANESSLEAPIYGYDMVPIHKLLNSWTKDGWFGL